MSKKKTIIQIQELGLSDIYFLILNGKNIVILVTLICTLLSLVGFFSIKKVYTIEKEIFPLTGNVANPFLSSLNNQDRFETVTLDINLFTGEEMFSDFKSNLYVNNYSEMIANNISYAINFEGKKEEKYKLYLDIIKNLSFVDGGNGAISIALQWPDLINGNKILNEIIDYKKLKTEKYFQELSVLKMKQALEVLKTKIKYYKEHEENKIKVAIQDLKMNIFTAKKSDIISYNSELRVNLPSYFQGYKALEEMLKHQEDFLKNKSFNYSNEYFVFLEQIETLESFIEIIENNIIPDFLSFSEHFYSHEVNKRLRNFLIFGFIVGFILSIIILVSRKKIK